MVGPNIEELLLNIYISHAGFISASQKTSTPLRLHVHHLARGMPNLFRYDGRE